MKYYQIAAIIPFYDANGENSTRIIYADGSTECRSYSVKRFMRDLLYDFHLDPHALRHWTFKMIGAKLNTPLIINDKLVFVPVKMRKGVGKQDGCYGYLSYEYIRCFENQGVLLPTGEILPTLSAASYVARKHKDAGFLCMGYREFKKQTEYIYQQSIYDQ